MGQNGGYKSYGNKVYISELRLDVRWRLIYLCASLKCDVSDLDHLVESASNVTRICDSIYLALKAPNNPSSTLVYRFQDFS